MSKLDFIKKTKIFLRKVIAQRKILLKHNASKLPLEFTQTEIANIDYAIPKLVSYDQIKTYIERKDAEIRYLIPTNRPKWTEEFRELLDMQIN